MNLNQRVIRYNYYVMVSVVLVNYLKPLLVSKAL